MFRLRISAHSARARAASSASSMPAITSARSTRAPSGAGVPGGTNSTGIGSGRATSTGAAATIARVVPCFADLAHAALEDGQPADELHVPIAGGLEEHGVHDRVLYHLVAGLVGG